MDKVLEEQARIQDQIDAAERVGSRLAARARDGRAAAAAARRRRDRSFRAASAAASRCAACCCSRRICCCSTSRRTTSTPSRWRGSSGFSRTIQGTVVAVTHDRYFLDNVAGWILELDRGRGIPWEGNYSSWLEQKQKPAGAGREAETRRQRTLERELEWIRMSPRARQAKGKARLNAYEQLLSEETAQKIENGRNLHRAGPAARRHRGRSSQACGRATATTLLIDDLDFTLPRGGIVGVIGPNGAGKTTLFRMITGQEKPDAGTLRIGETVQIGYVDQSRDALDPNKSGLGRDHRRRRRDRGSASARWRRAPTSRGSTSRARRSSARSARCRAASATACTWRSC